MVKIKYLLILLLLFTVSCNFRPLEESGNQVSPVMEIVSANDFEPAEPEDITVDSKPRSAVGKEISDDGDISPEITPTPDSDFSEYKNEPVEDNSTVAKVSVTAEKPLLGLVIGIDPGHQLKGNNHPELSSPTGGEKKSKVSSGTTGIQTGTSEYKVNLEIGLILKQALENLGAEVVMTRETNDVDISNKQRAELMNKQNVRLCIRLHCNGSSDKTDQGAMLLLPKGNDTKNIQDESQLAGEIIFRNFLATTQAKDAGLQYREDLTGFNWSTVPVCLLEMGFMSNPDEDMLLSDPAYQQKCVEGIANGVKEWYGAIN